MRDKDGNPLPNAHLQVLFNRLCKLLYYRIKPVFVFDGGVPVLKRQTMVRFIIKITFCVTDIYLIYDVLSSDTRDCESTVKSV
jgi:DNA excision repair protein ERCC-5